MRSIKTQIAIGNPVKRFEVWHENGKVKFREEGIAGIKTLAVFKNTCFGRRKAIIYINGMKQIEKMVSE